MKHSWIIALAFISAPISADVPVAQKPEVQHLLDFVMQSNCTIERNGTSYPSSKAVAHIEKKYAYFRSDIETTEEFIELSASKSTMSGNYYMVSCGSDEAIKTQQWLLQELQDFRGRQSS